MKDKIIEASTKKYFWLKVYLVAYVAVLSIFMLATDDKDISTARYVSVLFFLSFFSSFIITVFVYFVIKRGMPFLVGFLAGEMVVVLFTVVASLGDVFELTAFFGWMPGLMFGFLASTIVAPQKPKAKCLWCSAPHERENEQYCSEKCKAEHKQQGEQAEA